MATFSVNQVRQLYVVKATKTATSAVTNEGDVAINVLKDNNGNKTDLYFVHKGKGGNTRSDLIKIDNIKSITSTKADDMRHLVRAQKLELESKFYDSNKKILEAVAGEDFLVRIYIPQFVGMSDEEDYVKHGVVRAYTGMTLDEFYKKLAVSVANNMGREPIPMISVYLLTASTKVEVKANTKVDDIKTTGITGLMFKEVQQPWDLGTKPETFVNFEIATTQVKMNGAEFDAFKISDYSSTNKEYFSNARKIADLEYFCMGDRGDLYRNMGWPYVSPSKTFLDGTTDQDTVDIVYYYHGPNEDIQRSQKMITLVCAKNGGATLASAIKTAIA